MRLDQPMNIGAIVLAAGQSKRMGRPKALLQFGRKRMIAYVVETLLQVKSINPIIVVTGYQASYIQDTLEGYRVESVYNEHYENGEMLSSIKRGILSLPSNIDAFLLALGDQPLVDSSTIKLLIDKWIKNSLPITYPVYKGRNGHPLLFSASCINEILELSPTDTLKTFISRNKDKVYEVEVNDVGVTIDIDTPEDYESALKFLHSS
jgi:molybdenum cofactor cytidylyltransferase